MLFRCDCCKEIFEKGWTDEAAVRELRNNFPGTSVKDCVVACEECYTELRRFYERYQRTIQS